jgi:hypothetical protein
VSLAISTSGHFVSSGSSATALVISNVTPSEDVQPGQPGGFPATYATARLTPIEFDMSGIPSGQLVTITAKFPNQQATYAVVDFDGNFLWPFDDGRSTIGALGVEPVHVSLLPRDGWPPGVTDIEVASFIKATE